MTRDVPTDDGRLADRGRFVAGTRGSRLAAWQTGRVLGLLTAAWPLLEWASRTVSTHGDESVDRPLAEIGGRGAFTEAIEALLLDGSIDFAVHSLKDLPVRSAPGLTVAAVIGPREAGEVLVSGGCRRLADLPAGALVGTSSLRRQAQLLRARPDLTVRPIRGNVETRIEKVERGEYDATLLAAAGVERLDLADRVTEVIDRELMLPAPGQGAIAVQCRSDDERMIELLSSIGDAALEACTRAERSFLAALGGGCSAPVAALAEGTAVGRGLHLHGRVIDPTGSRAVDVEGGGENPVELGIRLAGEALARGAGEILRDCSSSKGTGLLDGRRIVVTRPREQAAGLSDALEAHGARVLLMPAVRIVPLSGAPGLERAVADLEGYRWIVFASANAARYFLAAAGRLGGDLPSGIRVAAVGPATASAVAAAGVPVAFVSRGKSGEHLGVELPDVEGARVLVPCAEVHGLELSQELEGRGALVTTLPVYRTEPEAVTPEGVEELARGVDAVVFTSASAVDSFLKGLRGSSVAPDALFERAVIACIGPSTAQAVERNGLVPGVVAEEHTTGGVVAALVSREMEKRE